MNVSPRLSLALGVVILGGTLYTTGAFRRTPPVSPAEVPESRQGQEAGGGEGLALATLRHDLELLRTEIQAERRLAADTGQRRFEAPPSTPPRKLLDELRRLQAEVATLRVDVQQTAASAERAVPPLRTVDEMDARTQAQAQQDRDQMAALETAVQAEAVDTQWSVDTTDVLTDVLGSADLGAPAVQDLECRTTMCRLSVEHDNRQALDQFTVLFPLQVGPLLPQMTFFHEAGLEGRMHTVIYLTRQGHSLSDLEQ